MTEKYLTAVGEVERYCTPDKMSVEEALDFLENVVETLSTIIQCLRAENPELD